MVSIDAGRRVGRCVCHRINATICLDDVRLSRITLSPVTAMSSAPGLNGFTIQPWRQPPALLSCHRGFRGQHEDRCELGAGIFNFLSRRNAVHFGHVQVSDDKIGFVPPFTLPAASLPFPASTTW